MIDNFFVSWLDSLDGDESVEEIENQIEAMCEMFDMEENDD